MKRLISLMAVFVLVFALTVPAFAEQPADYPDVRSVWTDESQQAVIFNANGSVQLFVCNRVYVRHEEGDIQFIGPATVYNSNDGTWEKAVSSEGDYWKPYDSVNYAIWSAYDIYDDVGNLRFNGEYRLTCDGSSCPATDVNIDGICDDCGMMLSLRSLTYPAFPSVDGSNKHYALVKTKYSGVDAYMYSVFTSDATYDIRGETPSTVYQIAVDGVADYIQYVTTDGQTWVEIQNSSVNNQSVGSGIVSQTTVIASTFDWYNEEGEHFFPVPLWVEVEEVTQGEMMGMGQTMGGTLKVLVPCGVGLMACLVVLGLFGKRLLIFRS